MDVLNKKSPRTLIARCYKTKLFPSPLTKTGSSRMRQEEGLSQFFVTVNFKTQQQQNNTTQKSPWLPKPAVAPKLLRSSLLALSTEWLSVCLQQLISLQSATDTHRPMANEAVLLPDSICLDWEDKQLRVVANPRRVFAICALSSK